MTAEHKQYIYVGLLPAMEQHIHENAKRHKKVKWETEKYLQEQKLIKNTHMHRYGLANYSIPRAYAANRGKFPVTTSSLNIAINELFFSRACTEVNFKTCQLAG
jgi:hypothetical protein